MRPIALLCLSAIVLAGCAASGEPAPDRHIDLRAWIEDAVGVELYPGLHANLWAFCFEAMDPGDAASVGAVEYLHQPGMSPGCSVPGPTLRVNEGDRVTVHFQNRHVHAHSIHWHGQHTPWGSDGVPGVTQDPVMPGDTFIYDFVATRAGTLWYHCHVDTAFHLMQGLYGAFIVAPDDRSGEPEAERDHVFVLSEMDRSIVEATPERLADPHKDHRHSGDCGETGRPGCQNPAIVIDNDVFLMNGISAPKTFSSEDTLVKIAPGERVRMRFINAGSSVEAIHPHGHDMTVTHLDGIPLGKDQWYRVDTLSIAPGQRIDVFIDGKQEMQGVWVMHTHFTKHVMNDDQYPGGMLSLIVYEGFEGQVGSFAGNLPGGQAYTAPPVTYPDDDARLIVPLGTEAQGAASWSFNISHAVDDAWISIDVQAASPSMQALNDVAVRILGPDGESVFAQPLDDAGHAAWRPDPSSAMPGTYTVELSGTWVESWATFVGHASYAAGGGHAH